jgi:hypothetical protein
MKSIFRYCLLLMIVLLAIAPTVTAVQAQGACLPGLQQSDCDLMTAAGANAGNLNSFNITYNVTVKATGLEGLTIPSGSSPQTLHDIDIKIDGNGPFSLDKSKLSAGASSDPTAALQNVMALTLGQVIKGSVKVGSQSQNANIELRIVDGKVYFKTDNPELLPAQLKGDVNNWLMSTLDPKMMSGMMGGNNPLGSAMAGGAMMGSQADAAKAMVQQFLSVPGFITTQKQEAGDEVTYTINVSLVTLLKSEQFKPMLKSIMASQGGGSQMTDQQLNQSLAVVTPFLENFKLSFDYTVGTQDKLTHGFALHTSINLKPEQVTMVTGASNAKPVDAAIDFSFKLTDVNKPVKVDSVPDAKDVTNMTGGGMAPTEEAPAQ